MRKTEQINKAGAPSLRFLYNTALGRILLKPLVCKPISSAAGFFLSRRISSFAIKRFIEKNGIDMSDYEDRRFRSFNDFFTRHVNENARPIDRSADSLVSPCDARLTVYSISQNSVFTVKGVNYTVSELLENSELAARYDGGYCLIFRLAVDNYHRYGWCADGIPKATVHIKGKYHTVQPIAMRRYRIFRENVREYTELSSDIFGCIVQMEVGALMVGRICNNTNSGAVKKGEEKGRFEFGGSTIIMLIEKNKVNLDSELIQNTENGLETHIKYGEKIGTAF